ncbi:hypothetical protein DTL21_09610 [Bremerella cremea]|uniref:EamA domain-containing protein n=1 Tax=Blastopirellula marina TaxID=124 RepID=A0A2S8FVE8_9BACT|nr:MULTISPECIES: hypothetical protein [Pirellulaceae]PQO36161.1 hypothetical protein C5Y83_09605 [Blastopirellula marina]RCS48838.1 hypothetical protein DTL21_09610 [Bremerella cremea]
MQHFLLVIGGIALTALSWGSYGPVLHEGQHHLGNDRIKPLICVGLAYLVIAVIIPSFILIAQGRFSGDWSFSGFTWSFAAGTAGTFGAFGIILALTNGGKPWVVMPLVFGFAPVVTTFISLVTKNLWSQASPVFYAGLIMVVAGAVTVLIFQPKAPPAKADHAAKEVSAPDAHEKPSVEAALGIEKPESE